MTLLSCLAIGLAFVIAVALLVFAGLAIAWMLPRLVARARAGRDPRGPDRR